MPFIYVKVPIPADFPSYEAKLHDALDAALSDDDLGSLVSWGASLGEPDALGHRQPVFHRIDLEVQAPEEACTRLKRVLLEFGALPGSEIHYATGAVHLRLGPGGWN